MSLKLTCEGKSVAEGGLSRSQLGKMLKDLRPTWPVHKLSKDRILKELCGNVCPLLHFVGATRDDIKNVESREGTYYYKGEEAMNVDREYVARGGYGEIYKITLTMGDGTDVTFVQKISTQGKLEEAQLIADYSQVLDCPGIVSMKLIDDTVIMPLAAGSLKTFNGLLTHAQCKKVITVVGKVLECMAKDSVYYFDVKSDNVLFRCHSETRTEILMGDMGSIIPDEDNEYPCTHAPPCARNGFVNLDNEGCDPQRIYTYLLSVLYGTLLTGSPGPYHGQDDMFYYTSIDNLIRAIREKIGHDNKYSKALQRVYTDKKLDGLQPLSVFLKS